MSQQWSDQEELIAFYGYQITAAYLDGFVCFKPQVKDWAQRQHP